MWHTYSKTEDLTPGMQGKLATGRKEMLLWRVRVVSPSRKAFLSLHPASEPRRRSATHFPGFYFWFLSGGDALFLVLNVHWMSPTRVFLIQFCTEFGSANRLSIFNNYALQCVVKEHTRGRSQEISRTYFSCPCDRHTGPKAWIVGSISAQLQNVCEVQEASTVWRESAVPSEPTWMPASTMIPATSLWRG